MKITCQSCQSKYTVSDEKVQGRTVKIKCRKCGATILVNSSGVTTNGGVADPVSGTSVPNDGTTYLVNVADGDQRSMALAEIVTSYQSGVINAETYVWADGMADWQPLGQIDTIVAALHAGSAPASVAAQEAAPVQSTSAPSGGAALGQTSPGVESVAAAAPRAAAVRRDPARPTQDLFGASPGVEAHRPSSDDVATSAPLFKSGAAPGQRDENSMLFSLSALTAKAAAPAPARAAVSASDDSGLIDLKALASGAGVRAPSPVASIVANDGGLFQLSAPIVTTARAPSVAPPNVGEAPSKNRAPLIIAAGIAIAGIAIAGVFFLMKGGGSTPVPTAVETAPPTAAAPATTAPLDTAPAPAPTAPATASATATAEPVASAAPSATPTAAGARPNARPTPRPNTGGSTAGKQSPAAAAPAPAAPAPAKRGGCGCAVGDLMCAMQCSAKGK
ncbi:zinc-ribbon domain-containing protein [Sorangium sp. So ce295]|jgi:predicted Zn finger-like uncharacterized protein|uniref:zinc-ribbon domain-containing protein n=1 Tax=unclassified Sorangium TaxID=2621164 RepID=UPI003F626CEC